MSFDLTNKNISDTYQNLLQKTGSGNQLYDLVGNPIEDLTIQGTIHAQSYIVSESVVVSTSGSTIFGNSTDDTHQFTGSMDSTGTFNALKIKQNNVPVITTAQTGSFITEVAAASQGNFTKTSADAIAAVVSLTDLGTTGNPKFNHITASGHISASGDITGVNLSGTNTGDQDLSTYIQNSQTGSFLTSIPDGTYSSSLQVLTNITASGNISASGTIRAEGLTSTDDAFVGDNLSIVTAQSAFNLSVDGTSNFKGNITIDEDVKLAFDSGFDTYIMANSDTPEDLEIHADQDILLKPDGNVGIGNDNPPLQLTVEGHISASGNFNTVINSISSQAAQLNLQNNNDQLSIPGVTLRSGSDSIDIKARYADNVSFLGVVDGRHSNVGALRFSSSFGGNVVFDYSKEANVPYVGIGNSFPTKPLTVQGDISSSGIIHSGLNPVVLSTQTGSLVQNSITASLLVRNTETGSFLVNSDTGSMGNSIVNGTLSVNTTHTPSGSFSVNYGDGAEMTGSIGSLGHGYGDITEIGGGTITLGRVHALEEDGDWASTVETGPISSSLLCVGLGDGKKLLRGTVNVSTAGDTTIGQKVYGGVGGRVTGSAPTDSGDVVRVLGYVLSGSGGGNGAKIYFNPDNTWIEVS